MTSLQLAFIVAISLSIPLGIFLFYFFKSKRRRKLRESEFSSEWSEYLVKRIPLYNRLPKELQIQLHGLISVFLDEKEFVGCGGLEIDDEIRVTVAGQACILLLNRDTSYYNGLSTIYIYPHTYVKNDKSSQNGSVVSEETFACEGEAWTHGPVVLTWDNVLHGASDVRDGHNVVLHEFAHKLDQESGAGNGTPILEQSSQYIAWGRILGEEFDELCEKTAKHKKKCYEFIRSYKRG